MARIKAELREALTTPNEDEDEAEMEDEAEAEKPEAEDAESKSKAASGPESFLMTPQKPFGFWHRAWRWAADAEPTKFDNLSRPLLTSSDYDPWVNYLGCDIV